MIQRTTAPQCLSARVSALADGSLPDDVRDRALAHVTSCPDCRADLDAERLLRARLQSLPTPRPSASLIGSLLAMGEPGGPVPPRVGHVPGMPRPRPATIRREPAPEAPWRRRVTTTRPGGRGATRRRAMVGATAGAVGAGVIAAALASGLPATSPVGPPALVQAGTVQAGTMRVGAPQPGTVQTDVAAGTAKNGTSRLAAGYFGGQAVDAVPVDAAGMTLGTMSASGGLDRPSVLSALPGVTTTVLRHLVAAGATFDVPPPPMVGFAPQGVTVGYFGATAR